MPSVSQSRSGSDIDKAVSTSFRLLLKFESAFGRVENNLKEISSKVKEAKSIAREIEGMAQELGIDPKKVDGYAEYLNAMKRASYLIQQYSKNDVMSAYAKLRNTLK